MNDTSDIVENTLDLRTIGKNINGLIPTSVIDNELSKNETSFIRFSTNNGKYIWDAEYDYDKNGTKVLKVYQVITKRDDVPILAWTREEIEMLEDNMGIKNGFDACCLWNPGRKYE